MAERQDLDSEAEAVAALADLLPETYVPDFNAFAKGEDAARLVRLAEEALAADRFDKASCRYLAPLAVAATSSSAYASYGLPLEALTLRPATLQAIRDNCEAAGAGMPFPTICDFPD